MEQEKLDEIFKKHKLWLEKVPGGERAVLRWADLRWADLKEADLRWADLKRGRPKRGSFRLFLHSSMVRKSGCAF